MSKILIVVIAISSLYPCLDSENISVKENIVVSLSTEQASEGAEDNCSPFCICACCSISFSMEFQNPVNASIPVTNSTIHLQDNYFFNPFLSIWQPPKV